MPYHVEVICVGKDNYDLIEPIMYQFNRVQKEVTFQFPSAVLRGSLLLHDYKVYEAEDVFKYIEEYKAKSGSQRDCVIGVLQNQLDVKELKWVDVFGAADDKVGMFSLNNAGYSNSATKYIAYYLLRYTLKFFSPDNRNHEQTKACFFDSKIVKKDLAKSLESLEICDACMAVMSKSLNQDKRNTIEQLRKVVVKDKYPSLLKIRMTEQEPKSVPLGVSLPIVIVFIAASIGLLIYTVSHISSYYFTAMYFVILCLLGVGVGIATFFGFQSYISLSGNYMGVNVQAGGSVAVMLAVILLGYRFIPEPELQVRVKFKPSEKTWEPSKEITGATIETGDGHSFPASGINNESIITFNDIPMRYLLGGVAINFVSEHLEGTFPDQRYILKSDTVLVVPVRSKRHAYSFFFYHMDRIPVYGVLVSSPELGVKNQPSDSSGMVKFDAGTYDIPDFSLTIQHALYKLKNQPRRFPYNERKLEFEME
jgi:hypothetical protein